MPDIDLYTNESADYSDIIARQILEQERAQELEKKKQQQRRTAAGDNYFRKRAIRQTAADLADQATGGEAKGVGRAGTKSALGAMMRGEGALRAGIRGRALSSLQSRVGEGVGRQAALHGAMAQAMRGQGVGGMAKAATKAGAVGYLGKKLADRGKIGDSRKAMLKGALGGALRNEGIKGIAVSAFNTYIFWFMFGFLGFSAATNNPFGALGAVAYLDFHYLAANAEWGPFRKMLFSKKLILLVANLIVPIIVLIHTAQGIIVYCLAKPAPVVAYRAFSSALKAAYATNGIPGIEDVIARYFLSCLTFQ